MIRTKCNSTNGSNTVRVPDWFTMKSVVMLLPEDAALHVPVRTVENVASRSLHRLQGFFRITSPMLLTSISKRTDERLMIDFALCALQR